MAQDDDVAALPELATAFDRRYLTDKSLVIVSLGSHHPKKAIKPADFEQSSLSSQAVAIKISARGADGDGVVVSLATKDNISTDPIVFTTKDAKDVKILFDLVSRRKNGDILARGVAILSDLKSGIGKNRMSLQSDYRAPLIQAESLEPLGYVNFSFLIVKPFAHHNLLSAEMHSDWTKGKSTQVIGHRGYGKNFQKPDFLQLGENTLQSFESAAELGASYVEFDVQLTKDLVPVIYHDFGVNETGLDVPMHLLSLEQFTQLKERRPARSAEAPAGSGVKILEDQYLVAAEKMKSTAEYQAKGNFKGNLRGHSIESPFTTLEEMLKELPESVSFNIEMKYPMLFEFQDANIDTYVIEINTYIDTVLKLVFDLRKTRKIVISSFSPDVCILLSLKQPAIPVLFLTDAGTSFAGDLRANSLEEAVKHAKRWNLDGIVSAAKPIVERPQWVKEIKNQGLACVTYGTQNNEPKNAKLQAQAGIDAVIVDRVHTISKALAGPT